MEPIGLRKGKKKAIHTFGVVSAQRGPLTTVSKLYEKDIFVVINSRKPIEGSHLWITIVPYSEDQRDVPRMTLGDLSVEKGMLNAIFTSDSGPVKELDISLDDRGRAKNLRQDQDYVVRVWGKEGFFELFEHGSIPSGKGKGKKAEPAKVGKERIQAFKDLADVKGGERILDTATGIKEYLKHFKKKGCPITCANISQTILDQTEKWLGDKNTEFVRYDIEKDLPFEEESFDVVICDALLEYLMDPHSALKKLISLVKPGGAILVLEPAHAVVPVRDFYPLDMWEVALWRPQKDPDFNIANVEKTLLDTGMELVEVKAIHFNHPVWENEPFVQCVARFEKEG